MPDEPAIPSPSAEDIVREYLAYEETPLYNHSIDEWFPSTNEPDKPRPTLMRRLEPEIVPVKDQAQVDRAKLCSDLYDGFRATADNAGNIHIPLPTLTEFLTLFHALHTPPKTPHEKRAELFQQASALHHRAAALARREEDLARRERAAHVLFSEPLLAAQLADVWRQGYEAGYAPGFERGRRAAAPVAYRLHAAALERILTGLRDAAERYRNGGDGVRFVMGQLGTLQTLVEGWLGKTKAAARQGRIRVGELMGVVSRRRGAGSDAGGGCGGGGVGSWRDPDQRDGCDEEDGEDVDLGEFLELASEAEADAEADGEEDDTASKQNDGAVGKEQMMEKSMAGTVKNKPAQTGKERDVDGDVEMGDRRGADDGD